MTLFTAMACWAVPALGDENAPDSPPFWWNDPQSAGTTVKAGWNFNDNDNPDEDQRPDWCDDAPYALPGGNAEPVDMGGSHGRGLGIPANDQGRTALVWFHVDNQYASALVKELWLQYDLYKSGPVSTGLVIEPEGVEGEPAPVVTDHKYQRLPKDLGDGWTRYTVRKWITPQCDGEWIKFEFTTVEGHTGSVVIDNVWIGTHCELQSDSNHCEGHDFRLPFAPPEQPEPAFYCSPPWYEGTHFECYGSYPPEWMPEVTDHEGVIGMPTTPLPEVGEIIVTFDDQFSPDEPRHIFYQYDRYTGGGEIHSDEWLPPGTVIENRVEEVEELSEGWERVRVFLDVYPRPEAETIHFTMLSSEGLAGPVAIDNLIVSLGVAEPPFVPFQLAHAGNFETKPIEPAPRWSEKFDSYANGSQMHGQGGWKGWANNPAAGALVTDAQASSVPHSVDIVAEADLVHEFAGCDEGRWTLTAWQFIPPDFVGGSGLLDGSFLVMMNTYSDSGPWEESDWSAQLDFDSNDGMLKVYYGDGLNTVGVPYETDRWVEIEIVIDLDADWTEVYYDEQLVVGYSWTGGVLGGGGGASNIAAIDLYANGSTSVYYDDLSLVPELP